jgi:hypothetical protein
MTIRRLLAGAALTVALLVGGVGTAAAAGSDGVPANCVGQHVSAMAQEFGGMPAATAHHNEMHGTALSVGEHQAHIRDEMCGR